MGCYTNGYSCGCATGSGNDNMNCRSSAVAGETTCCTNNKNNCCTNNRSSVMGNMGIGGCNSNTWRCIVNLIIIVIVLQFLSTLIGQVECNDC